MYLKRSNIKKYRFSKTLATGKVYSILNIGGVTVLKSSYPNGKYVKVYSEKERM
jgi:hypothetical protein